MGFYSLTLLPLTVSCFLCVDKDVISQIPSPLTIPCLPSYDGIYLAFWNSKPNLFMIFLYFMCMNILLTCKSVPHLYAWCCRDQKTVSDPPETGVTVVSGYAGNQSLIACKTNNFSSLLNFSTTLTP